MRRKARNYLSCKLLFLILIHVANAMPPQSGGKPWLAAYNESQEYDGIYVVKKVDVPCRSYQTYLVDGAGRKLTPAYRDIGPFADGLAEFVPQEPDAAGRGMHGFINRKGEVVIPPKYVATDRFYKGKTWVIYVKGKQYGISYLDTSGKIIHEVPVEQYPDDFLITKANVDHVCSHDCREDVIWWRDGDLFLLNWNFSRYNEKEIQGSKGIYHFNYKGKYGIIDKHMILRVPVALDGIDPTYKYSGQGMERVQYGNKFGYVSPYTGDLIVPFQFEETRKPTNGLFWVKKNGKWGCIDKTGKVRINFLYDEATGFTAEDRSAVAINGKFGHIDKSGKIRTPLKYDFASYYNNGVSMVRVDDKYGYIDTTGHFVTGVIYDEALPFDQKTTTAERSWLRFRLSLDGSEQFAGFSYKLNAVLILIGLLVFVRLNSFLFRYFQRFRNARSPRR
ncbi:WG repeat-containing protein [Dyadobacter sandarakinus]|uniref:WG repeat-containing protein n=1 Tax=Dyadobacter sandarakinus TaxID=2747268 RepID=A0ABX7I616_9BACT|nr:WG repeat-containing protein [Dyadobacter sandarakinus]QRR00982.1 WG repeat-containing protein [Dyadobacter sandarakinus]